MAPNMKANERLGDVAEKLKDAEAEADLAKKASKAARDRFNEVRRERLVIIIHCSLLYLVRKRLTLSSRTELFRKAFDHISERIDKVYKDLTKGKAAPMGGVAYLNLEDSEASV